MEVILVLVSPAVDIEWLDIELEGPVGLLLFVAVLIKLGDLHHREEANVISDLSGVLSDSLATALIHWLTRASRPSVLEEVEGFLAVEIEHGEPVSASHTITKELDTVARSSVADGGVRLGGVGNAHNNMLSTSEHTSVRGIGSGNEFHFGDKANRVSNLLPTDRHSVTDSIEADVHVRVEEGLELRADEEPLAGSVLKHFLPDDLLLADSGKGLVLRSIKVLSVLWPDAVSEWVLTMIEIRLILTPIVGSSYVLVLTLDSSVFAVSVKRLGLRVAAAGLVNVATLSAEERCFLLMRGIVGRIVNLTLLRDMGSVAIKEIEITISLILLSCSSHGSNHGDGDGLFHVFVDYI